MIFKSQAFQELLRSCLGYLGLTSSCYEYVFVLYFWEESIWVVQSLELFPFLEVLWIFAEHSVCVSPCVRHWGDRKFKIMFLCFPCLGPGRGIETSVLSLRSRRYFPPLHSKLMYLDGGPVVSIKRVCWNPPLLLVWRKLFIHLFVDYFFKNIYYL